MSALQLPPTTAPARRAPAAPATGDDTTPRRPHLRLVESPPRRSLAPSGPAQAWRRRIGLVVVAVALVVAAVQVMAGAPPVSPDTVPVTAATVVVEPGQTLWDVAVDHAPAGADTGDYVDRLAELNGVTDGALDAWQVLRLPNG